MTAPGGIAAQTAPDASNGTQAEAAAVLPVFLASRGHLPAGWAVPDPGPDEPAGDWIARCFRADPPHDFTFTGYYEPVIEARRQQGPGFDHPLYALPPFPAPARAEIMAGALSGRGLELAYLRDPLDAFLLQVQGSGRLLIDGRLFRLGHAGTNGLAYRSIGAELIRRGAVAEQAMGIPAIRAWAAAYPGELAALLAHNPAYAFFRWLDLPDEAGPLGTLGLPVTAWRSLAVDPEVIPLGALLWVEVDGPRPFRALMVAQDTGGAIKGARADIFTGTGAAAGQAAGTIRHPGRIRLLRPRGA